jgi:hypothetical protein
LSAHLKFQKLSDATTKIEWQTAEFLKSLELALNQHQLYHHGQTEQQREQFRQSRPHYGNS